MAKSRSWIIAGLPSFHAVRYNDDIPWRGPFVPTLIVENVPVETYERLQERAAAEQRSVPEEALHLLNQLIHSAGTPAPRVPDFVPSEQISAPCDLPRSSRPTPMRAKLGQPRLPDQFDEAAPE